MTASVEKAARGVVRQGRAVSEPTEEHPKTEVASRWASKPCSERRCEQVREILLLCASRDVAQQHTGRAMGGGRGAVLKQ